MKAINKHLISDFFSTLQETIAHQISDADGEASFIPDKWERQGGGGGVASVLQNGAILEKAGVNFSAVWGETPDKILDKLQLEKSDFFATGVSIVMHPHNPFVPIIHMNVRYFEMSNGVWWFGGGIDLTPHYINEDDAKYFHQKLKNVCDQFDESFYPKFKTWADDYFYIKHRQETRGIGGIFFDHLNQDSGYSKEELFQFVLKVGQSFSEIYSHLMIKNNQISYNDNHKKWQFLRRGRYVEFNLVYDRGTKFGLDTDGRVESILMSLPPQANWIYNYQTELDTPESETLLKLKKGINWIY